jgi:hypothetical protein
LIAKFKEGATKSPSDVFNKDYTKTSLDEVGFLINKLKEIHYYQTFGPPIKIGYCQDILMQGMKNHVRIIRIQNIENPDFDAYICPPYTEEQFLEVSAKVLPKLKIAHVIGKAVWDQRGDIRDVISIGKLVRKNDGPEKVGQILSTITKYGEMKEH